MVDIGKILKDAIESTKAAPVIQWNDSAWSAKVNLDPEFSRYMNNHVIEGPGGGKRRHGYFALLSNIVSNLLPNASICELGNREGLSTLAILDAMNDTHTFITIDTVEDLRFLPFERVNQMIDDGSVFVVTGDVTHPKTLSIVGDKLAGWPNNKGISLLFCDTIHVYEQVQAEFEAYEKFLCDEAIILVDDIQDDYTHKDPQMHRTKYRFFEEWDGEKYDLTELCHDPSGFGAFVYRRKK